MKKKKIRLFSPKQTDMKEKKWNYVRILVKFYYNKLHF